MPVIVELGSSQSDPPRSPASISTEPNRRPSFKAVHHPEKDTDPPTSISPLPRLTRKRAASLNTESARLPPSLGDLALGSPVGPLTPDVAREQVCLCQPDPKIPRPRNGASSSFPLVTLFSYEGHATIAQFRPFVSC
jgi:hypothetical protein